jgi:hypothetical protein
VRARALGVDAPIHSQWFTMRKRRFGCSSVSRFIVNKKAQDRGGRNPTL